MGGEAAEVDAGAVRSGGDRSGDRLSVDVAQVFQRQACGGEGCVELRERGAAEDADQTAVVVNIGNAGQLVEADLSVAAISVNEWPAPTGFTGRPACDADVISWTRSSTISGLATRRGVLVTLRDQFLPFLFSPEAHPKFCPSPR